MAPEEGVGVRRGRDGVPPKEELVVEADAEGEDVSLSDDDPVRVCLWTRVSETYAMY